MIVMAAEKGLASLKLERAVLAVLLGPSSRGLASLSFPSASRHSVCSQTRC